MAIPFIIAGAMGLAAMTGVGTGTSALFKSDQAEAASKAAFAIYNRAQKRADNARENAGRNLEELGLKKLSVLDKTMNDFVATFEKVHAIQLSESNCLNENSKFALGEKGVIELRKMGSMASSLLGGIVGGIGAGAMTAYGAYSATMAFASASTGTAIASLSGAAASNATLAFLGGGSLAAGGGGMVAGMATLGGIAVAPAIAILGITMNASATQRLENAKSKVWQARELAEGLAVVETLCNGVAGRAKMYTVLLDKLEVILAALTEDIKKIIADNGFDYRMYRTNDQNKFAMALSAAGAIKRVIDTPVLNDDGSLTEISATTRDEVIGYIKSVDSNSCDDLPEETTDHRKEVDYSAVLHRKASTLFGEKRRTALQDSERARNAVEIVCRGRTTVEDILYFEDMSFDSNARKGLALTTEGVYYNSDDDLRAEYLDIAKVEVNSSPRGVYVYTKEGKRHYICDVGVTVELYKLKTFIDCAIALYETGEDPDFPRKSSTHTQQSSVSKTKASSEKCGVISGPVAEKIYRILGEWTDYIETEDYIVYEDHRYDSKNPGICAIKKETGKVKLLIPEGQYPRKCGRDIQRWVAYRNTVFAFFSDESYGPMDVFVLDVENGKTTPSGFKAEGIHFTANRTWFITASEKTCFDLVATRVHKIKHDINGCVCCTEKNLYFVEATYPEAQLIEYSLERLTETVITALPYGLCRAITCINNKVFILLQNDGKCCVISVDLASQSKAYKLVHNSIYIDDHAGVWECGAGWAFVQKNDRYSLVLFDFESLELRTLAQECGYSKWNKGGLFSKGYTTHICNRTKKIGNWLFCKQGENGPRFRVALNGANEVKFI